MRDPGTFAGHLPLLGLVHQQSLVPDNNDRPVRFNFPIAFMVIDNKPVGNTVPVFSDGDLASRFLETLSNRADFKIIEVDTAERLAAALVASRAHADSMSFDQPKFGTGPCAIWPLEYAI